MNKLSQVINDQVNSCKKLLKLFQGERQLYITKESVGVKEVKAILEKKKMIVEAFEGQHAILKKLKSEQAKISPVDEKEQREGLRVLSSLLEQLLVIDHENEKLLKKLLSVNTNNQATSRRLMPRNNTQATQRAALQTQLPFVPDTTSNKDTIRKTLGVSSYATANKINSKVSALKQYSLSKYA